MPLEDYRSRLFLVTPRMPPPDFAERFVSALSGGDIGCLLLDGGEEADRGFQTFAKPFVETAQDAGIAVLVAEDTRLAGRLGADGIHVAEPKALDAETHRALADRGLIIGFGGISTRHLALQAGEREPDYLFFGRLDREPTEDNHPKTESLSLWWAEMMTVPCVALAGTSDAAFTRLAEGGVDFIAVRDQIWQAQEPGAEIARLNDLLDIIAQRRMEAAA